MFRIWLRCWNNNGVILVLEFIVIVYLGVNFASGLFFYISRLDVSCILGGEDDRRLRFMAFVGMLLFGTLVDLYLIVSNLDYVMCMLTSNDDDYSFCSGMRTTNNFSGIKFAGDGD